MPLLTASRLRYTTLAALALLEGCIVVPNTTTSYDQDCQLIVKHVELRPVQVAELGGCIDAECGALLAIVGVAAVGSAVISGSISIIGNAVYWIERQGQCARPDVASPAATAGPQLGP